MKIKWVAGMVSCLVGMSAAQAGSLQTATNDLTLAGGIGAAGLYSDNTGTGNTGDPAVTDFLLELSAPADKGIGFTAGLGNLQMPTVLTNVDAAAAGTALQYGWVTIEPMEGLSVEAGKIATKIGYEVAPSYANANVLLGAVWNSQPVYYGGARASYTVGSTTVFAELNEGSMAAGKTAYAVGVGGEVGSLAYSLAYSSSNDDHNILDVILSTEVAGIALAANVDLHTYDNVPAGQDDSGTGIALYAVPSFGAWSVPVRIEILNDGTSGAYGGMDKGTTYAVTPTYNFTDSTFVRAEFAYAEADNKIFTEADGVTTTDSKTSAALQAGFLF